MQGVGAKQELPPVDLPFLEPHAGEEAGMLCELILAARGLQSVGQSDPTHSDRA